jgi:hypothetical protein
VASVDFGGFELVRGVERDLARHAGKGRDQALKIMRRSAHQVERFGKQFARVDTGAMRSSITLAPTAQGMDLAQEIGPTVDYAIFEEFGTVHHGPAAFMGPALDRVGPEYVAAFEAFTDIFGAG